MSGDVGVHSRLRREIQFGLQASITDYTEIGARSSVGVVRVQGVRDKILQACGNLAGPQLSIYVIIECGHGRTRFQSSCPILAVNSAILRSVECGDLRVSGVFANGDDLGFGNR